MGWSVRKKQCCGGGFGLLFLTVGVALIPIVDYVVRKEIEKTVILKKGNLLYETWRDLPIPIYMQFYMFDCKNPDEVKQGHKPFVVQKGPYTYIEKRTKYDLIHNINGTVTYKQNRTFHFARDLSVGPESDRFTTLNPVYWSLLTALKWEKPEVSKLISFLTTFEQEYVFMNRSVKEILWGYQDPTLHLAKGFAPEWFYTDIAGYFINKNATNDGVYTIFTGETDINKLGRIDQYNGSRYLNFWNTKWANMINGSDATIYPPFAKKSRVSYAFASDVCRSIEGIYSEEVTDSHGFTLWRYTAPDSYVANATNNPDNIGFCTPNCLDKGLINVSNCQTLDFFHIPAVISLPHFYLAADKYREAVMGMNPNKEEHQTIIDAEPNIGWVLRAAKKIQINLYIQPIEGFDETSGITPVFLPVFWLNESAVIDEKNAKMLKNMLFTPLQVVHVVEIVLIAGGSLLIVATIGYTIYRRQKKKEEETLKNNEQTNSSETSPLIAN
ncbi:lysosome membrane protein 2-like isoform X2 [Ostrea edulis]|uniref:lysosome membrane protein 2-like isoform X2 n=1 Tax=Ostrea edulis TaxID=37623 RepID=UPI00209544F8|nr:lysosome membrane protein 2-like isoform X2 [Ostrea edulis]XP_056014113.1 lysosome membrane protein 2-like isoform X2 [Ostrea edulis]